MKTSSLKKLSVLGIFLVLTLSFSLAITETGDDQGTILVGSGNVYQCEENWTCSWSTCIDNSQTYDCTDLNNCGTTNLKPANSGTTQECGITPPNGGGGNGGGGSGGGGGGGSSATFYTNTNDSEGLKTTSCQEKWFCNSWSNAESSCGTRECTDLNKCGTEKLKPIVELECERLGLSRFTGAVVGGVQNVFQEPRIYIPIIAIVALGIGVLMIPLFKKKDSVPKNNVNKQFKA